MSEEKKPETMPWGAGPPLEVLDEIPKPETVFNKPKLTPWVIFATCLGPAALSMSGAIGSGEWLMGPSIAAAYGLGLFWMVWLGSFLQTVYNLSFGRLVIATGESPGVMMSRTYPRIFWIPFMIFIVFCSWAWPGWALGAATGVMTFALGHVPTTPAEVMMVKWVGITLFFIVLFMVLLGKKIERTLEIWAWFALAGIFIMIFIALGLSLTSEALNEFAVGVVSVGYIPKGIDIFLFGGWWGYIGWASGINWMLMTYYRDKEYGMAHKVGFIPAVIGAKKVILSAVGKTFKLTDENVKTFKRWVRLLNYDQWLVFFLFALLGMWLPALLVRSLVPVGTKLPAWGIAAHCAEAFAAKVGPWGLYWISFIGVLVLFTTQVQISDVMMRNITDIAWFSSARLRKWCREDVRYVYYILLIVYIIFASWAVWQAAPLWMLLLMANIANFSVAYGVPLVIYYDRKLPKELRMPLWYHPFLWLFFAICLFLFIVLVTGIKVF
jgi:hypothetical protein